MIKEFLKALFHLHDIDTHEVSLVDHGAIDEPFTDIKSADRERVLGLKWVGAFVKNKIKSEKISVEALAEKSGIASRAIEAIASGGTVKVTDLLAVASALGLDGAALKVPKEKGDTMNKEEMEKFVKGLLAPFTKALDEVKKELKARKDDEEKEKTKTEEDKKKTEAAKAKEKPEDLKALTDKFDVLEKEVKECLENIVKDSIDRFKEIENLIGAKSTKIEGQDDDGKKKTVKWPSFSGRS